MGRGTEQTFSQRRHTQGQRVHEKALTIATRQGHANQNHSEEASHICQNAHHQEDKR